jgi:hypothetical protein
VNRPTRPAWPPHGGWRGNKWWGWNDYWHRRWLRGRWQVNAWPPLWVTGAFTPGWLYGRGDVFVFNNPFYVVPAVGSTTVVNAPVWRDYSQPLPAPPPYAPADEAGQTADPEMDRAMALFDEARAAFKNEDFAAALARIDQAIDMLPSDATLHEFRALCLFAMNDYQQAAAAIYAVLAAGPGWNWETLASLYPNVDVYTRQLRALEAHVHENRDDSAAKFLLAYHYMTAGHLDAAVTMWEQVAQLLPEDQLTAQLLEAFRPAVAERLQPGTPSR